MGGGIDPDPAIIGVAIPAGLIIGGAILVGAISGDAIPGGLDCIDAIPGGLDCIGAITIVAGRGAFDASGSSRWGREPVASSGAKRVDSSCGAECENSPGLNGRASFENELGSALCGTKGGAPAAGRGEGGR